MVQKVKMDIRYFVYWYGSLIAHIPIVPGQAGVKNFKKSVPRMRKQPVLIYFETNKCPQVGFGMRWLARANVCFVTYPFFSSAVFRPMIIFEFFVWWLLFGVFFFVWCILFGWFLSGDFLSLVSCLLFFVCCSLSDVLCFFWWLLSGVFLFGCFLSVVQEMTSGRNGLAKQMYTNRTITNAANVPRQQTYTTDFTMYNGLARRGTMYYNVLRLTTTRYNVLRRTAPCYSHALQCTTAYYGVLRRTVLMTGRCC